MASFNRVGQGPGGKFANKNLNSTVGVKTASGRAKPNVGRGNLLFIQSDSKRVAKPIGAAAAPAPIALNTPSIRKENNGKDISINLVPVGVSSVWGQSENDLKKEESQAEQQQQAQLQAQIIQPPTPSVAPWAKRENTDATSAISSPAPKARNWSDINDDDDDTDNAAPSSIQYGNNREDNNQGRWRENPSMGSTGDSRYMQGGYGNDGFRHGGHGMDKPSLSSRGLGYPAEQEREGRFPPNDARFPSNDARAFDRSRGQRSGSGEMPLPYGAAAAELVRARGSEALAEKALDPKELDKLVVEQAHAERQFIEQRKKRAEEERLRSLALEQHEREREARRALGLPEPESALENNQRAPELSWNRGPVSSAHSERDSERGLYPSSQRDSYPSPGGPPRNRGVFDGPPSAPTQKVYSLVEVDAPRNAFDGEAAAPRKRELYDPAQGKMVEVVEEAKKTLKSGPRTAKGLSKGDLEDDYQDKMSNVERKRNSVTSAGKAPTLLQRPKPSAKPSAEESAKSQVQAQPPKKAWGDIKPQILSTVVETNAIRDAKLTSSSTAAAKGKSNQRGEGQSHHGNLEDKALRARESKARGPRTKGFLFNMDPMTKQLVQVLSVDEAALPVPPPESGFASLLSGSGDGMLGGKGKKKGVLVVNGKKKGVGSDGGAELTADGKRSKAKKPDDDKKDIKRIKEVEASSGFNKSLLGGMSGLYLMDMADIDETDAVISSVLNNGLSMMDMDGLGSFVDPLNPSAGMRLGGGLGMGSDISGLSGFSYLQGGSPFMGMGMGMGDMGGGAQVELDLYGAVSCLGDDDGSSSEGDGEAKDCGGRGGRGSRIRGGRRSSRGGRSRGRGGRGGGKPTA